jgi:hypothetical protein
MKTISLVLIAIAVLPGLAWGKIKWFGSCCRALRSQHSLSMTWSYRVNSAEGSESGLKLGQSRTFAT